MPINSKVKKLYDALKADGGDVGTPEEFNSWFFKPGKEGYKNRKSVYDTFNADGADVGKNYEEFGKWLGLHAVYPTVNKYRQQMFKSVDPNKSRASELTHRAVGQAVRATNNVRKPVVAKVVNRKGKPTGEEFAITPAKTVEDLDREYAQAVSKNWENELHDQMADADKDAAKISDMFKSFIGSTDEVGSVWGNMTRGGGIAGTPHSVTTNNGILENTEARQLLAAGDYNRKRRELLQLEQDSRNGAIFDNHSFFRGMYDAAKDTGFLTGGASDLINAGSLLATKQDLDNGVHTEAGDMLMQQAVKNSDAQSQYGDNQGWMYTGGVITTNMAPFMVQIGSAGFSKGMSNAIGKVVQGAASKVALGTMEKATGMAGAHIANYIGKVTGLTTKAFGKAIQYGIVGAAQANTVGLGNVANDVINRYTGQVYQDEQGNYKFGTFDSDGKLVHEGGEDFLTALVKGEAAQTIEFATELAGGGIDAAGTALKNFVTKGGKKIINKYNMENVSKVIDFLLNNKVSKNARYLKAGADRTLGKVEVNSIVGESLEEELGIIANTVFTGDNKISDLWDEKQQSQIWGGMLLSIGLMKGAVAPFHAYNAKQYYSYKHKLDKADVNLSQLLGKEKWEELRNQIDATTNKDMPEMVNKINRDVALGKNRQPVREYIQNLLIMRGYDIGNMLAAKKAVEDKGEGVSVKNMEKNQAYQQGRDAYGYDTHEIQLDQEDKQKSLAQLLGISEQQLASMSDEELEALSGRDDNIERAIYDYQLSNARYEGVIDNARDQIDLEVQRAAQAVDMYTDKSRNTIRNATIKATGGLEDYGVYIINGNIDTHEDGSIDISNSDDMILYYDPTTNTVEHADAMMFDELGSEENADEVRSQAMADAKEKAIKETTGIIDGVVEVGTQFKTVDADGTEHTYEVLADNGDGTAMITIDGNIPTELVKGENVNVPVLFEELQKMKDESDQQRLQAAKAQREQMEKERAEQQMQAQTTQAENPAQEDNIQSAPIEDNLDYSDIIRKDGKVQMVDVSDKDGNNLFPDAKDVFYIQGNKMRTKFAYIDANGELKTQSFPTGLVKIKTKGEVSVDDYKKYRNMILSAESSAMPETSMIEDNSGSIEADRGGIEVDRGGIEVEDNEEGKLLNRNDDGAQTEQNQPSASVTTSQEDSAGSSESKDTNISANGNENNESLTFEDGTPIPVDVSGEVDLSQTDASHAAEWYDNNLGEDADDWLDGEIKKAKKVLEQAKNKKLTGTKPSELVASKKEKEAAIADAQAHYDSAISIRDSLKERRIAKEENTAEGRKELIEKARRKFARLKSAVKDDAEAVAQIYKETVGTLLHRLYDVTGIDVTDTIPLTAEEYVASNLGAHSLNYEGTETSNGVKQETGLSREDFAKTQLLAADGKGTTIDNLVHSLWENRPSNLDSLDTQNIRNAMLSIITSGFKASEARNYIENLRIAQAENILEEQKKAADNAAFAEENKAESEQQTETAPESEEKTREENSDEENDEENEKINEQTNENINAPEQNKFPDKLREGSKAIEVPEDATDENPLGLQLSEDKVPFEIEGGKSGETYNINDNEDRQRLINDNKVDDKDILDIDMPKHVHKAIKELCKKMGLKVQFLYMGARSNGWIENGTMYLALDTEKATQFVFGHEMTHVIKQKNPEAYKELVKVAMAVTTRKKFEEDLAKVYQNYYGISGYNNIDDYVEEVVADKLGKFINDFDLAQKFSLRLNHPVLATILHAIQKIKGLLYGDFYKSVDALERIVEKAYVDTAKGEVTNSETGEDVSFSLRQKPEPKKKGIGYKVFVLKDGKLYPPMVANPDGAATPVGVWLDADAAPIAGESKTGRPQVKQGGKGTQGGSGKLAYRPGWHLGVVPYAIQFNRKDAEGNKTLFPKNFVFAEVEYAADVDYQEEARQEGINPSGKYQHSLAGLKHLPTDGYYMYRTNPNPETDPWVITGAMKVNRILTRAEQADLVSKAGREPQQIQEGDIVTDDVVNSINQEIADAPKFSLKDNQENPLNQDGTLKLDKIKSVDELTDEDFTSAFRNVELPAIPKNVDAAIGANGKPIVIKKNIFEKNWNAHKFTPAESKKVLNDALYNTDLVGHTQPTKKPNHWVAIKLDDKSPITVLEVNDNKNNVEVVGWYTLDERNLGRIKRQAERNGGELIMLTPKDDKVESLSTPPLSSAAKIDNSSETAKENGEKFSLKNEKTMFGMHNISVDKLRKAIKQGGFAAPSMGVVDSKNGIYSDYGEITLIPKAEKLAKRTGKNAGTFTADAWTPTYPQVERIMNKQGEKAFNTDMNVKLGDVDNGIYSNVRESWKGYLSSGDVRDGLYWHYLFDNGMNPETIYQTGKYDNDITNEVMRISDNGNKTDYTDKEVAELIQLMNKATGKDNDVDAQREKLKARIASAEKQGNHLLVALKKKRLEELEGVENFYIAADFVNDVVRNNRKNGKVDVHDTMGTAKKKVEDNKKLSDDFPSWLDKKTEEYGVEEMLYNGTTPSGKPKYIPNTIENAVKLMKKQGVAGGYTAFGSELGVFIAKNSPEVNTLAAMKNAKDKLIPFGDERHNQIKDKITKEFLELSDEIRVGSNNRYAFDDSGVSRMVELTDHKGNEKEYLKKAYNIEVSDEWMDRYNKLLDTIKKDYKVFYFETKFMRPYGLDEFEKAIVPSDTPSDVIDALKKAGIDVSSYERGNAEDRQKVTMDAINSSDNIRFSLAGERGAAAADKAEERTFRMDNLSVAKDMEKNKKKDKAIKAATGWERGADGKWRYEMPDVVLRDPKEWVNKKTLTLSDIVEKPNDLFKEYPELFDAYPKLKDVKIQKGRAKMGGSYYDNTITLNLGGIREAMKYDLDIHYKIATRLLKRTLVHEVQHYIQHEEGFAKGGSEQFVRDAIKDEFEKVIKQIRGLRAEGKEDEAKALAERNKALYNAYSNEKDSYKNYKSLSGEVEARNVSARLKMTPEERRKALAESTEDVARKDQIFLGVGDVSFSLRDMADGKESGAADMAEDLKSLNTPDEVDDAIKTAIEDMPSGWKMANKKMIHIAQALGENRKAEIAGEEPKFSLKDGTLIKAGTYFSGGGLVEEGLKGIIDPVVAVEYDEKISGVYRNNFGQHIVTADVRDVDPKELVKQIDGEVEYFHASPVCKNYSQAKSNHAEVELDKETAASTAEFINAIKPKVVTIENVKGYKDSDAMKTITDALDANGYTWDADVYNAADYGGYTNRERLIVRAVRDGKLPEKPKKMAHKSGWYEAVADIIPTLTEKKNGVAPWMDIRLKVDGIDWRNIDKPLYVMGSAYADGKIPHAFADELLPTLRTKSGDVIVMPDGKVYRAMGRVLARVSGVSDDYKMPFSENLSHTIIGNGIPTQLTEHVIAPLLQNTLRPTTPEDGNTKFSLRGSTPYDKQMEEWMEKNHLEKGAVPMEKPIMKEGENIFDYANRMVEWTRNQNLWKTAPKQTGFQDALDKWKADNGLSPDAYPPVRPHRENYSTEIGYAEDLEEYNKKKELWKSAPKPKDFDLSVDLEDMNKQLRNIRRAVLNQKNYDQRTVKAVSDLVRKMLNIGWGDGLSRGKVGNLLSAAKNATGANDVKKYLDKAMGILAENYLNRLSTAYDNLINTKGARADQSGVIKMGSLDAKGQAFMSEYKKAINMDDKSLNNYIANIEEDSAKNEDNVEMNDYRLAGIQAAIMYKQQIGGNDADIAELKKQIGELKNKKDATKEDKDLLKSLEKKLFENKFDRITMYENLLNNIQRMVKESKGRAKEFREEITEHKNEILHRANLDLEGVDSTYYDTTTAKKKLVNNDLQRAVFSSTYTFEQFLKFFGKKAANGEGYLYNYFTKLNQDALDEEQLYNEMNRNALDEKTKELFGKEKFMKLVGIDGKGMKEMDVEVTDYSNKETGKRTIHLKQGQMLYIYLVNKETDGEMKLRAMGITEEDVAAIEENLDPRVKAMGEWLQDEYLPECQRRYQATHTKYFGAPMKDVENYFPLAINNRARNVKEDVNQDSDAMSQLAGTFTGAIVTRRVNVIPLDIENADAFEVAFNHLQEMEEWSAMLPFRQDINTLLSYTHFRNQVQNMSSVAYGSGKTLWNEFKQTAQIAAGTYKPKVNAGMMDSRIAAAMGGIAVAKISGRLWTAIKQSQSATVFLPECDFTRFVKNGVNPYGSWKWAKENIPDFRKRIENITYGDVKLRQYLDELEKYHDWTKVISKWGMAPNILVDGITCAVGARSVYETEVNRLTKLGYPKEKAEEKAYYKAVAAYNKTQQSSGGMYLSPMQVDRTYVSAALSLFKNANYAYGRMQIEACRGLARTYDFWGGKHKTTLIESMTRQIMEEDGLDENTARAIAKATYNRTFRQSIGRLINFATLVPVSWALYKVLPYLLTGDDDDKKKDMIEEAVLKGFATSLSDNYVIPFASNILNAGLKVEDGKPTFDQEVFRYQNLYINPATSDLANIYSMVGNQKWYSVANKLGMLGVQSLIGFNPETVGALYQALSEADYDNGNTAKEWQIGILKAISAPEESIRELYMDELGLKSGDIKKIPLAELEKRYAERQINRDNLLSQIGMDAETFNGYVDKYQKSFEKKIKDKMDKWDEYDKKKADEFFDTTSDHKLKDMIEKKRTKDANAAADEQIAKEGLNQEKKGKEPSEEAYDAVKMSIDVAEDNAISTYNKVLYKRYAVLNDEYNNQTDAMKYIFMNKHPNFKAYKDLESEYTTYGKKMKELKEKLVSADGYDAKQTILKQIRAEREKFSELQSKVR
jgi:site-specific DNA-cytosine methylase|nr:MAG TPA: Cytosine specific methyltransferase [Caudoviricetes sp.]